MLGHMGDESVRGRDAVGCRDGSVQRYLDCQGPTARAFWVCSVHGARLEAGAVPVVVHRPSGPAALLFD